MDINISYMQRCIDLAMLGAGHVAPNPMVGSVIVHNDTIIGEGYHEVYGKSHAEVNAVQQVIEKGLENMLPFSTLYVSLEPCAHHGKTPPCADLIIRHKIPNVVIGCRDPFVQVNGKGIERLQAAGVNVTTGIMETECQRLNKRFFTFHALHRPYIILKWAQTGDHNIGYATGTETAGSRLLISNEITNRLVHKWRSEEAGILIGTNTALYDDPSLTTRLWPGKSPTRLVIDRQLRLPSTLRVFDSSTTTIVFNDSRKGGEGNTVYHQLDKNESLLPQLMNALYQLGIQSVIVEGGAATLRSFIDNETWDEARIITNTSLWIGSGVQAPILPVGRSETPYFIGRDRIEIFYRSGAATF